MSATLPSLEPAPRARADRRDAGNRLRRPAGWWRPAKVFDIRRTAYDTDGAPIRLTITVCPADRNQFAVNVGMLPDSAAASGTPGY